jgi:sugar transferase EpsL
MAPRSPAPETRAAVRLPGRAYAGVKRSFDVALAATALIVTSPVLAIVAAAVRLTMGSPVLWRQERSGQDGRPFLLAKVRTMRPPAPGEEGPENDDVRLTPVGRALRAASLDELPSLWNVLVGDMSLVGPRPLPVRYLERYSAEQARRLDVRPGLTGWAQINGRNDQSWDERFRLDLWYVANRSLRLDLAILLRTPLQVLRRRGIAQPGHATMPEFTGETDRAEHPGGA